MICRATVPGGRCPADLRVSFGWPAAGQFSTNIGTVRFAPNALTVMRVGVKIFLWSVLAAGAPAGAQAP